MTESANVRVIEETPAYWRVVFDYPPFNIVDATIFEGLQDLLERGLQREGEFENRWPAVLDTLLETH